MPPSELANVKYASMPTRTLSNTENRPDCGSELPIRILSSVTPWVPS